MPNQIEPGKTPTHSDAYRANRQFERFLFDGEIQEHDSECGGVVDLGALHARRAHEQHIMDEVRKRTDGELIATVIFHTNPDDPAFNTIEVIDRREEKVNDQSNENTTPPLAESS